MSSKAFQFADFVEEFQVTFIVHVEETKGDYDDEGKWIPGAKAQPQHMIGIILPLTTDELQKEANGTYTRKDRKIYTLAPLKIGQKIEYKKQMYTIDANKDYEDYADVYMYYAKGVDG